MMELAIIWSILIAQVMLAFAMAFALYRIIKGPRAQDRILGLDTLYIIALLGFVSSIAFAKFIMRGEVIE
jgi:multicomponent K+:H+ antiporter subunit F